MPGEDERQKYFEWLVESRSRNQRSALALRAVLRKYEKQWKTKDLSTAAQELTSVSFSLWRAAFLVDKTGSREAVFAHGTQFLERVIEDNAISYTQDKLMREWSFNYYTRNARFSLEYLNRRWPDIVNKYDVRIRPPKIRWEYCQGLLEDTVARFEKHLSEKAAAKEVAATKKAAKATSKRNRATVRKLTLSERTKA